jgi:S1-C subfamily serine protease
MNAPTTGGRETRLLLMTIGVSVGMLLLLAQFRFPEAADPPPAPAAAPLERLAARATYDELAGIMAEVERRVAPSIVPIRLDGDRGETLYAPAVRLTPDRAIALVGPNDRVVTPPGETPPTIVGRDPTRGFLVLQVEPRPGDVVTVRAGTARPGPRYLVVVEATREGAAVRPVYVGRTDIVQDTRGGDPVLIIAAAQQTVPRGSAIFTIDAEFLGLAADSAGAVTIVPAERLQTAIASAPAPSEEIAKLGIHAQPLSPAVARAAGAKSGIVVTHVETGSIAHDALQTTDVIEAIDGKPVTTVPEFEQLLQAPREPAAPLSLSIRRSGKPLTIELPAAGSVPTPHDAAPGAIFQNVQGTGVEVISVLARGPAGAAGLQRGDLVIALNGEPAPDPAALYRAYRALKPGQAVLLTIQRGSQYRVFALEKP